MEEDRYAITIAMAILMAILATTAVTLRFMARRVRKAGFQADDYTIVVALVILIGQCTCNIIGAVAGQMGTHYAIETTDPPDVVIEKSVLRSKVIWALNIMCAIGPGLVRTSILLLYLRIFLGKVFMVTTWTLFALNVIWALGFFFSNLLSCVPISGNWATGMPPTSCVKFDILFQSMVISNVLLDGLVLTLPWYPVWQLNMPTKQKCVVCGIFLLGAIAVIASSMRTKTMFDALVPNPDRTWTRAPAFYWATIETGIGIVSACLPTLRPLFSQSGPESIIRSFANKLRGSVSRSRKSSQDSSYTFRPSVESYRTAEKSASIPRGEQHSVYTGPSPTGHQHQTLVEAPTDRELPPPDDGILVESSVSHARTHNMV